MTLPATDNFNRDNGALGANWTGSVGNDLTIVSQAVYAPSAADASMYWSADAPNAAQYAQCKLVNVGSDGYFGPLVRASATDWVLLRALGISGWEIKWYNGNLWTTIASTYSTNPATNDIAKLTADSSTFKGYVNGVQKLSGSNASAPASGYGGLYDHIDTRGLDDFEVGNLDGGEMVYRPALRTLLGVGI